MLSNRLDPRRTAPLLSRGGFTLVELLVVIGIIAILAGVALGPISNGIKQAQHSAGMQNARSLALAEFQYANDNGQAYPFGTDAGKVADQIVSGGYVSDPGLFFISGSKEIKYTPTPNAAPTYAQNNVSWDFGEVNETTGLGPNAPDQTPVVISSGAPALSAGLTAAGVITVTVAATAPFGTAGMAVCYKSNSAKFIVSPPLPTPGLTQVEDASWPGYTMILAQGGG